MRSTERTDQESAKVNQMSIGDRFCCSKIVTPIFFYKTNFQSIVQCHKRPVSIYSAELDCEIVDQDQRFCCSMQLKHDFVNEVGCSVWANLRMNEIWSV